MLIVFIFRLLPASPDEASVRGLVIASVVVVKCEEDVSMSSRPLPQLRCWQAIKWFIVADRRTAQVFYAEKMAKERENDKQQQS